MIAIKLVAVMLGGYVCGSIPTSIWTGRVLRGIDIREHGSGNAGATNAYRVLGWRAGLFVVLVDIAKGLLPTLFFHRWLWRDLSGPLVWLQILVGACAILGHVYTLFARFRGGKGVGTAAGVLLALFPLALPICLLVFVLVVWRSGMVSLASMCAALTLPLALAALHLWAGRPVSRGLFALAVAVVPFIIYTHRGNILRIWRGEEHRFGARHRSEDDTG